MEIFIDGKKVIDDRDTIVGGDVMAQFLKKADRGHLISMLISNSRDEDRKYPANDGADMEYLVSTLNTNFTYFGLDFQVIRKI